MISQSFIESTRERARSMNKHIVYPDATDERALRAARIVVDEKIARITLVGNEALVSQTAKQHGISLDGISIADPSTDLRLREFANILFEKRKAKGMTSDQALEQMSQPLFFGATMVAEGSADGSVAGSLSTTGDVLRAAILCIGLQERIETVSSFFLMIFPESILGFADCAVVPDPTAEQLADIAITTGLNFQKLTSQEARVAMLSFSTHGSAEHPLVEKVQNATKRARTQRPEMKIDGELQFDAAIIKSIGRKKAPYSEIAGTANVLVFPDLNAGNIGYKIAQRLGGAEAIGPIVQGLRKPAFDLSRGCSVEDIVAVTALNAIMSS